ncbi:ABC transporter permease/M1 family aminopeptidase [Occallatibacter riparius]|uniref:ABC transporter permease subunit n=1 Tax=Occallatibacter riparius TaxID=1002689 RepID=A0A9J7BPA7_9BACT|nr:M1 family aminopeptidase [Occallatibacter riparius]UWZ84544.1 ABC transporter permease subunit [Occallatibacter riparius]
MLHFFWFEVRYWLRSVMLWVFTAIVSLLTLLPMSTDQVQVGGAIGNTFRNAPYVVEQYYSIFWFITLLMVTAFANSAAAREFAYNMHQIVFTKPIRKLDFLIGRFLGAVVISTIPMLGISLGALLAKVMPWADADRFGPVVWSAHLSGIFIFALPNTLFIAAILFTIAALTRSTVVSFLGGLGLLVANVVAGVLTDKLENEKLAAMVDPFGNNAFALMTKYWTVADRNTHALGLTGLLLWNRLIWLAVGILIFAFCCWRFSFAERQARASRKKLDDSDAIAAIPSPAIRTTVTLNYGAAARWRQLLASIRIEYRRLLKTVSFIVITCAALLNSVGALIFSARQGFGLTTRPVTYALLQIIAGTLYLFLVALITFFAGVLVWEERDARTDEVSDALPVPEWPSYVAKFIALITALATIQVVVMIVAIWVQAADGYTRFQLGLYIETLLGQDLLRFAFLAALAFLIHVLSPNKYVGYFAFIGAVVANTFMWRPLHVGTRMVQFGSLPAMTYSDFFGYQPWMKGWTWFAIYWILFSCLVAAATILFWPRGKDLRWKARLVHAQQRFRGPVRALSLLAAVAFIAVVGWVYYNTEVLNQVESNNDTLQRQADYEKNYKRFEHLPQPRVTDVHYDIAIYPATRELVMRGSEQIKNETAAPIDALHLSLDRNFTSTVDMAGMQLAQDDKRLGYRIYKLTTPLAPGEVRTLNFDVESHPKGFENTLTMTGVVQNGSFFNSSSVPQIGYQENNELTDPNDRRRFKLKEKDLMPELVRNCTTGCMDSYISNNSDWVNVDTIISTSADQMAIAPGSLLRQWQQDGRNFYEYKLDHFALNFYSFISARYQVQRSKWNDMDVEVYYLKEHPWNVSKMVSSIEKSFAYYTTNYGPYYNKQARIVEFPRVASFAQAFPGTMPYSESIGFIADIEKPDDIDMVFYVVAHEMGHQWWAHQVVGANMQGATSLSETLAQYSALMVMEKQYGPDTMRKFMQYEMDNYLRSRGTERLKERPLMRVEASQGYIHYRKGSVVMYYLRQMIGEDAINRALRKVLAQYRYAQPPYPTSWALVDALRSETPQQYQYLLKDLFEDITLFSNRTTSATAHKRPDGKYDVTVQVETHKYTADAKGAEQEIPVDDWIEVGALAAPAKGDRYGKVLVRQQVHMTGKGGTYTFVSSSVPDKGGIDPLLLLVDRVPDDNMKKVDIVP